MMKFLRAPPLSISSSLLFPLSLVLTAGIFLYDLLTPLGFAIWLLYVIPLLLLSHLARPRLVYMSAAFSTLLLVIPPALQRSDISWMVVHNKFVGIIVLWVAAYLLERKRRAEQALQENERRQSQRSQFLETLLDSMEGAVAVMQGRELRFTLVNCAYQAISPEDPMIGRTYREVFPEAASAGVEALLREVIDTGVSRVELKYPIPVPGRPDAAWDLQIVRLPVTAGEEPSLLAISWDMTEHKRAQDALRESETRYRELVQNANSAILRWSADGTITFFNEYAQKFFGYSAEEILGRHASILVPDREATGADLTSLVRDIAEHPERYLNNVNENVCRDGRRVWMTWSNRPIFDDQGRVTEILAVGSDITALKATEGALKESENRFRTSLETMLLGFSILSAVRDETGRIVDFRYEYINEVGCRLLGRSREEMAGRTFVELFPQLREEKGARIFEEYVRAVETGEPLVRDSYVFEGALAGRGVTRTVFDFKAVKMGDGIAVCWADKTRESEGVEALRRKAEELETLLASVPVMVLISHDTESSHGTANPAAEKMLRLPPQAEISLTAPDGKRPTHYRTVKDGRVLPGEELPLQRAARGEVISDFEFDIAFDDGSVLHMVGNATPLIDRQGAPRGAIGAFTDITERKRMEEALRERESLFRRLFDESPLGTAAVSLDFQLVRINKAFAEILGYSREELMVVKLADISHPEDLAIDLAQAQRILDGEIDQFEMEKRFFRKDGFIVRTILRVAGIRDEEGRLLYFLGLLEDVTERKRMEDALRVSLQEKDVLLRELSHRTKNNMQVISGLLNLQAARSNEARVKDALSESQDRIQAMALVHEKLYKGGSIHFLDFKEYARDLTNNLLKSHQGSKGLVKLELELEEIHLPYDMVLPCGLIVNELISNSLKHALPNSRPGTIFISLRKVEEKLELRYKDDGLGLPEGFDISRIETLGLKLVRNLAVQQLRGSIELAHSSGATEFVFLFPLQAVGSDAVTTMSH